MLADEFRAAWPYEFGLVYSVTLTTNSLETALQVSLPGASEEDLPKNSQLELRAKPCCGRDEVAWFWGGGPKRAVALYAGR
jgi:hypothetical protein